MPIDSLAPTLFAAPARPRRVLAFAVGLLMLVSTACVGGAWKQALEEDTPAAYHRFLREHGESEYVDAARERLDFHKLYRNPSLAGYKAFRRRYPNSDLLTRLQPALQKPAFDAAFASGTAEAYQNFLDAYGTGDYRKRAQGNLAFVESQGFGGDADQLGEFAADYPESDYAAEATRTVAAVAARRAAGLEAIGLVLHIDPSSPERKRVREALVDRVGRLAEQAGVRLAVLPDGAKPSQTAGFPAARIEIQHVERAVGQTAAPGELARPAMLGTTDVALRIAPAPEPVSKRRFEIRLDDKAHVRETSVLFGPTSQKYWEDFFVPVAGWRNDATIRPPIALSSPVVDLDGKGDRAIVLYEDGDFEVIGLADPTEPVTLARYSRGEDYKKWSGVRALDGRVAIFGEEGLEFVRFTERGPEAEKTWTRGQIGRVLGLAPVAGQLVIVGAKGMQLVDPTSGEMRRVMRRVIKDVDTLGETMVFVDGESVYLSTLPMLAENRVIAQLKLGRTFGPDNVRVVDQAAVVTGPGGALVIDLRDPSRPQAAAKLSTREIGEVLDATRVRGRTFLVGERGMLLLSRQLDRVEETIDVGRRMRVSVMGRHLVAASPQGIQVVDATPWATSAVPAAQR